MKKSKRVATKNNKSIRSHYVPQLYQNNFLSPGEITFWVYDKRGGEPRSQQPHDTAVIRNLYKFQTNLEQDFSIQEGRIKPILDRWQTPGAIPEPQEIITIAPFLAYLHTRGPRGIRVVKTIFSRVDFKETHGWVTNPEAVRKRWDEFVQRADAATLIASKIDRERLDNDLQQMMRKLWEEHVEAEGMAEHLPFEEFQELVGDTVHREARKLEKEYLKAIDEKKLLPKLLPLTTYQGLLTDAAQELEGIVKSPSDDIALHQALRHTEETIVPHLLDRTWCLCTAPEGSFFVTCDTPVFAFDPNTNQPFFVGGFRNKDTEVVFPISPKICLILSYRRTQKRCRVSERWVAKINRMTVLMAERFVMSPVRTKYLRRLVAQVSREGSDASNSLAKKDKPPREAQSEWMRNLLVRGFLAEKVEIDRSK